MASQLLNYLLAVAVVGALALGPAVALYRAWLLVRHGGLRLAACLAGPAVLGCGAGHLLGHPLLGATLASAAGLLLLARVHPEMRKEFAAFVGGLVFCVALFSSVGAAAGSRLGHHGRAGAFLGLAAALGAGLVALTDDLDPVRRPPPARGPR
jgi:hypothetical protein